MSRAYLKSVADRDDPERYELIKAHIRTRAVENVISILSVNAIAPYQTAPTGLYDKSGRAALEMDRGKAGLLVFDIENAEDNFGELGRRCLSDAFVFGELLENE